MNRRNFLSITGTSLAFLSTAGIWCSSLTQKTPVPVIIDADTANEIDDLYAITRALLEPDFRILSLSSAQWQHHLSPERTAWESQKLNEDILRLMDRQDIPRPMGGEMIVGKPWGGTEPSDSPAVQAMIQKAREIRNGEKLIILSLGALTNVASAVILAPDIIPRISLYCLSSRYYADRQIWDKDEFNARMDLNALNAVLNTEGLELHLMPVNILFDFRFRQEEVLHRFSGRGGIWDYLAARWLSHAPQNKEWIMWDLALVEAVAHPEWAEEKEVFTPPENEQRKIHVYTGINREALLDDWWAVVDNAMQR